MTGNVHPIRILIYQVNDARSLLAAGYTKRARRKLRRARRRVAGCSHPRLRRARALLSQAILHMIDLDYGTASDKARGAVHCLIGVMS